MPARIEVPANAWLKPIKLGDQEILFRFAVDHQHGRAIRENLRAGLSPLPIRMQEFPRGLLTPAEFAGRQPWPPATTGNQLINVPARNADLTWMLAEHLSEETSNAAGIRPITAQMLAFGT